MIDIHSHVLHNIDDGSKDIQTSIDMCRISSENGYNKIVATPHYIQGTTFSKNSNEVIQRVNELNKELLKQKINIQVLSGMEVFASLDILDQLKDKTILTLNNSKYILIEFESLTLPKFSSELLYRLQLAGYKPIFAHPERNLAIANNIEIVRDLKNKGIYIQINKGSILGELGKKSYDTSKKLLKEGLVDFIATDSHGVKNRNPEIIGLDKKLINILGEENTHTILKINPQNVLLNLDIKPIKVNKRKSIFLFNKIFN